MSARVLGSLRRGVRWLAGRLAPGALVLAYHRVAEPARDPQMLCVTPGHFAEHLEVLGRHGRPVALRSLVQALREGRSDRRSVAVTFDDGYADNLLNARPLLERYDTAATVFVVSGHLGSEREFWWDELERILLRAGRLPPTLRLDINGSERLWELGEAADYSEAASARCRFWNVTEPDDPGPRQAAYRSLCRLLRNLPEPDRRGILDEIVAWSGGEGTARATHRALTADGLLRLADGELVDAGAHTVTHPFLSALPADAQRAEIGGSRSRLEDVLGRTVDGFAYPYGSRPSYTAETVSLVREAGFTHACASFAGVVRRGTEHFQLPRAVVRDWDGDEFARRLRGWFGG